MTGQAGLVAGAFSMAMSRALGMNTMITAAAANDIHRDPEQAALRQLGFGALAAAATCLVGMAMGVGVVA